MTQVFSSRILFHSYSWLNLAYDGEDEENELPRARVLDQR